MGLFQLLHGARLYAPEDRGVCDVLLCGGMIAAVGPRITALPEDTQVVEASGRLLAPGLIDQHVHLTGGGGESSFRSRIRELALTDFTLAGVTTTVGVLGTDSITRTPESLLAKAKGLTEEGITAYALTGAYEYPSPTITGSVKKDVALIAEILGVKIAISDHRSTLPQKQELARLAADVRQAGLISGKMGVVHMHTGRGKGGLSMIGEILDETDLPVKHFRPTHMENCFEDAMWFGQRGGYIDFTADDDGARTAEDLLRAMAQVPLHQITLSSDAGGSIPMWDQHNELVGMGIGGMGTLLGVLRELVLGRGVEAERALCPLTRSVADGLLLGRKGRVAPGMDADLLLLTPDWELDSVWAKGRRMVREGRAVKGGYYEEPGK